MSDITFAQIEAALVTHIEDSLSYLEDCSSYAGQIEDASNGLPVTAPACFVMFDGFIRDGSQSDRREHIGSCDFSIVIVADSYVGGSQHRTGEHGAYEMIDDVIAAVDDHSLGITGFSGCSLAGVEMVLVNKLRAIYRVRFNTTLSITR